jgi:GAF domain-containing protein
MNDNLRRDPTVRVRDAFRMFAAKLGESRTPPPAVGSDAWPAWLATLAENVQALEELALSDLTALADAARQAEADAARLATENRELSTRCLDAEVHGTDLATLCTAGYQLQMALDPDAAIGIIVDIAVNLIGAAEFSVCLVDDASSDFVTAHRQGDSVPDAARRVRRSIWPQEEAAIEIHRTFFVTEEGSGPIACTPLFVEDRLVGVLSIYRLLSHKEGFTSLDWQLMDLLAAQAAIAITSGRARQAMDRKLKTVQGFIDLIKR